MVEQVEDILAHVLPDAGPVNFVGHSTGGLVSIMSANRLGQKRVGRLALVSPALWASKPMIVQLADKIPDVMYSLLKSRLMGGLIRHAVADAYLKNCDVAFAKEEKGNFRYPEPQSKAVAFNKRLFKLHPYAHCGIAMVNSYVLRADLLPKWRDEMREVVGEKKVDVTLIYGTQDLAVPFTKERIEELGDIRVVELENQGHESLLEDSEKIIKIVASAFA